nr:hypothetical protein [uncultured Carboxylicivirga sp.]
MSTHDMLEHILDDSEASILVAEHIALMSYKQDEVSALTEFLLSTCCFVPLAKDYPLKDQTFYNQIVFTFGDFKFIPSFRINQNRNIQIAGSQQSELANYISQELKSIRNSLTSYTLPPFYYCIKESLIRHQFLREEIYHLSNPDIGEDIELWWLYFLWKFSWLLLIYEPELFDLLTDKIETNNKQQNSSLFKSIITNIHTKNPTIDGICEDLKQVCRLLMEHQILTEFQYCLKIDKKLTYEEFIHGKLPSIQIQPNHDLIFGYNTSLEENQIINLFKIASSEYITTNIENLKNLLSEKPCTPIIWKFYRGKRPNKFALRAFIDAIFNNPKEPKTIAKTYFIDKNGKPIELSKPVKNQNYHGYIDEFKKIIDL